jgi:hypothetical protein
MQRAPVTGARNQRWGVIHSAASILPLRRTSRGRRLQFALKQLARGTIYSDRFLRSVFDVNPGPAWRPLGLNSTIVGPERSMPHPRREQRPNLPAAAIVFLCLEPPV